MAEAVGFWGERVPENTLDLLLTFAVNLKLP